MILHLFPDGKFLGPFYEKYRKNFGEPDLFYVYRRDKKFPKLEGAGVVYEASLKGFFARLRFLLKQFRAADRIILHSLFLNEFLYFLLPLAAGKYGRKYAWVIWGGDLGDLYEKEQREKTLRTRLRKRLRSRIIYHLGYVLAPTDFYESVRRRYKTKDLQERLAYYFYPVLRRDESLPQNYIMVGHSAHPASRHIETYRLLAQHPLAEDCVIYSNLSYGYSGDLFEESAASYLGRVEAEGKKLFGERYLADTDFSPYEVYMKKLMQVRVAVFNNSKEQGFSNIANMLVFGTKLYMSQENGLYEGFKQLGAVIRTIDELGDDYCEPLSEAEKAHNRRLIEDYFSDEAFLRVWGRAMHE